jgi:hypothetical protein
MSKAYNISTEVWRVTVLEMAKHLNQSNIRTINIGSRVPVGSFWLMRNSQ